MEQGRVVRKLAGTILQRCLSVVLCVVGSSAALAELKSVRDYMREPDFQEAQLSPDGDRLAVTQLRGLQEALLVIDVANGDVLSATQFGERTGIANFMVATNDRLLIQPSNWFVGFTDAKVPTGEVVGINYNGRGMKLLFGFRAGEKQVGSQLKKRKSEYAAAEILDRLPHDPDNILIGKWPFAQSRQNPNRPNNEAMLLHIRSGRTRTVARSPLRYANFVPDRQGEVNLLYGNNERNVTEVYVRENGKGDFTRLDAEFEGDRYITPLSCVSEKRLLGHGLRHGRQERRVHLGACNQQIHGSFSAR